MKRIVLFMVSLVAMLCAHDACAQRFIDLGYAKQIYRSPQGVGLIPILEDMNYNGASVAFRYEMLIGKAPDSPFTMQVGAKYDFHYAADKEVNAKHTEHYVSLPILFNYYIRNRASRKIMYLFAGPSITLDLSSKYRQQEKKQPAVVKDMLDSYGYTNIDVMAGLGVGFVLNPKYDLRLSYNFGLTNRRGMTDGPFHTTVTRLMRLHTDLLNIGLVYKL